jgi:iron complex outermembrane receptor protein
MNKTFSKVSYVDHDLLRVFGIRKCYFLVCVLMLVSSLWAQPPPKDLTQASLEDLMNVQVTSVSKKEQRLSRIGAAVFVISQEDIRRSGSTNIPDILRMVPGVNVARIDAHTWSVSIRGFSELYGNKVLVMIDGRAMYRQSFSGVRWDEVDVPLESIERIEVIRGPGGTVWGANAVNGVINIISKSALDTQGGLLSTAAGSELLPDATMRFGGVAGQRGAYRVFGRFYNTLGASVPGGGRQFDGSRGGHAGFRFDRDLSARDSLMLEGDAVRVHATDGLTAAFVGSSDPHAAFKPTRYTSGAVMARWSRAMENGGQLSLQFYDDYYERLERDVTETRNTIDFSLENHLKIGTRHDLVWGLGYRHTSDRITQGPLTFNPPRRIDNLYSGFLQDEIRLTNWLALTLGAKIEHNPYTGFENEPSAQLIFTPSPRHTLWASAGRAVRQTSRLETHLVASILNYPLPTGGFGELRVAGNPNSKAERLSAFEGGYRVAAGYKLSLDLSAFSNHYRNLQTRETLVPFFVLTPTPHVVIPVIYDYKAHASSFGGEVIAKWTPTDRLRLTAGYALLRIRVGLAPTSNDVTETRIAGSSPRHRVEVGTFYNLTRNLELDARASYTGRLTTGPTPAFAGLNLRVGWRLSEVTEFSVSGQNLLQPRHAEFPDADAHLHTEVERSLTAKFVVRF